MPTHTNNRIVFDINKVAYAWRYWRNQHGETRREKPGVFTLHSKEIGMNEHAIPRLNDYPFETVYQRAKRLGCLDIWFPVVKLRMSAADVLEYSGEKANSIWLAWCERQFNKKHK